MPEADSKWPRLALTEPTRKWSISGTILPEHRRQGFEFDRITQGGAGAVGFDVIHFMRLQMGSLQCGSNHRLLRKTVGNCQTATGSILIDSRPADEGKNAVVRLQRIAEAFESNDTASFAPYETVCPLIESLAPAVRCHHAPFRETDERLRCEQHVYPAGQCQITFAFAQTLAGQVNGDQRRGTCRIYRHGRTVQSEHIREATCSHVERAAGRSVNVQVGRIVRDCQTSVVRGRYADKYSCGGTAQLRSSQSLRFPRPPK